MLKFTKVTKKFFNSFNFYMKIYIKFSIFLISLLLFLNFFFIYLPEYYDFPLTLNDPYTIYAYGLVLTHNYVMWYIFLILIFVYWLLIQILRESIWNTFYKKIGFFSYLNTSDMFSYLEFVFILIYLNYWNIFFSYWNKISEFFFMSFFNKDFIEIYTWTEWVPDFFRSISDHFYLDFFKFFIHYDEILQIPHFIEESLLERKLLSTYSNKLNNYYYYSKFMKRTLHLNLSFRHSNFLEFLFALFPSTIIILILIPSLNLLYSSEDTILEPEYTVKVIGHQWYWSYEFTHIIDDNDTNIKLSFDITQNIKSETDLSKGEYRLLEVDNLIQLPISTPIRFLITSSDVLHSWSVPAFGIKLDAIPGRLNAINTLIFSPGTFYGQCSELCGVGHGFMPIKVETVPVEDFKIFIKNFKVDSFSNLNSLNSLNSLNFLKESRNNGNFFFDVQDVFFSFLNFLFFNNHINLNNIVPNYGSHNLCKIETVELRPIIDIINLMWVRNAVLRDVCIDSVLFDNSNNNLELFYNVLKNDYVPFNYIFNPNCTFETLPSLTNLNSLIDFIEKTIYFDNYIYCDIKKLCYFIYKDISYFNYKLTNYLDSFRFPEYPITHMPNTMSIHEYNSNYNNILNLNSINHIKINIISDTINFGNVNNPFWGCSIYHYSELGQTISISFINCNYNLVTCYANGEIAVLPLKSDLVSSVSKHNVKLSLLNPNLVVRGPQHLIDLFYLNKIIFKNNLGNNLIHLNELTNTIYLSRGYVSEYDPIFIKDDLILHQKELLKEYDFYYNKK